MKRKTLIFTCLVSLVTFTSCTFHFGFFFPSSQTSTSSATSSSSTTSSINSTDLVPDEDSPFSTIKVGKNIYLQGSDSDPNQELEIYFFQLENQRSQKSCGDAFFIDYGDVEVIIDCGVQRIGSDVVVPYLQKNNIIEDNIIELAINTHTDEDHIGGFVGNSNNGTYDLGLLGCSYDISIVLDSGYQATTQLYKRYLELLQERVNKGTTHYTYSMTMLDENVPSRFYLGSDTYIDILDTKLYENDFEEVTDLNDSSIPVLLTHGENTFLLMGDCEKKAESRVLQYNELGKVDFFKANHHGSPTSNTEELLNVIDPEYIVIDSTAENQYNLPKKEIVDRFLKYTENIYAPFINGGIHIYSDKTNIRFVPDGFIDYPNGGAIKEGTEVMIPLQNTSWYETAV